MYSCRSLAYGIWHMALGTAPRPLTSFSVVPELSLIDDFTVSTDGATGKRQLVFAHYGKDTIESVDVPPVDATSAGKTTVLVPASEGLHSPTSVRYGDGSKFFPAASLFVTEGALLSSSNRVLRVDL